MIVRADLPRGIQAANIIHAAGKSSPGEELPDDAHAVCLVVPGEPALRDLSARLAEAGIKHARIIESDAPHTGCMMAIGCAPVEKEVLRRHLSALPLLR